MPFIPHTDEDIHQMLHTIGVDSIDQLFDEIPTDLRTAGLDKNVIPERMTEMELSREMLAYAAKDEQGISFIGAGAYDHYIPAAVWDITSRGEFLTAYTPYQPEASQGTLQLLYEYQTMMAGLMGLDVSNASLYDGASALAEAVLMAIRCNPKSKSNKILVPKTLHPHYRKVVQSIIQTQGIELVEIPYVKGEGYTDIERLNEFSHIKAAAFIIPQPNFFGVLEDVDTLTDWAHEQGMIAIGCVNPLTMAVLKEPGQWGKNGVDIACGEGQSLGVPLASGGPYFGFLCCKQAYVRQMPGRIVGKTMDLEGKRGFVLTLQAREQHIRRAKATSNICTNQGLLVTAATIYMSLLGPVGLKQVANQSHANALQLLDLLTQIEGVERVFNAPLFHEVVLRFAKPVMPLLQALSAYGIQGGYMLTTDYPELGECLLVCATETKTQQDLTYYQQSLMKILQGYSSSRDNRNQAEISVIY